jgi:putative ABC transport system substrate-binding protein
MLQKRQKVLAKAAPSTHDPSATSPGLKCRSASASCRAEMCYPFRRKHGKHQAVNRRDFITLLGGASAAWPLAAHAQQSAMPVVGFLSRSLASDSDLVAAFGRALNETGYVNGQNVAIEFRWADGQLDRLPELAAELIERKVAVLFAGAADVAAGALRVAAATVPVVFATGSDPVAAGLVASFNRPGGNLTAVTGITNALWLKRLELLRELISPTPLIALLLPQPLDAS